MLRIKFLEISILILSIILTCSFFTKTHAQNSAIKTNEFIFKDVPFKACHASTIESTNEGLVASWFGGTKEGNEDVRIWVSRKINGEWTDPESVANGIQHQDKRYPTWNPVLFQYPNGPLMLFYKVGPHPSKWWGMLKTSNDAGKTWSTGYRLPEDILGPIKNKPILTQEGRLISPSSTENDGWRVHFEMTSNHGKSWELIGPINDASQYNVIQPSILKHGGDTLQILARSKENYVISSWSYDSGYNWTELKPTNLPNPNSGTDAVTLENGTHLLVYNHSKGEEGKWGGPRTPLNVAVSKDGNSWQNVLTLENEPGEYSYPAVIQSEDGLVHITYTWKRERIKHIVIDPSKL
ncbi:exo-alpha-sialidase [Halalkalibaculum sp. DA3122]|uniref:sialidase family protein n=1 Tax=Halalkalibaculum sp. DA3122 TaxID=3373607 RepID=UPI003754BA25